MSVMIRPPHVEYKDVSNDMIINMGLDKYPYLFLACNYENVYFGMIAWDEKTEQYCFFPIVDEQIKMPVQILGELYEKIYTLMADRRLN